MFTGLVWLLKRESALESADDAMELRKQGTHSNAQRLLRTKLVPVVPGLTHVVEAGQAEEHGPEAQGHGAQLEIRNDEVGPYELLGRIAAQTRVAAQGIAHMEGVTVTGQSAGSLDEAKWPKRWGHDTDSTLNHGIVRARF